MAGESIRSDVLNRDTRRLLGITVLLSQLPLLFHLPWWLAVPGMLLVLLKTLPRFDTFKPLAELLIVPLVMVAAMVIFWYYEDFFGRDPCVAFLFMLVGFKYAESGKTYDASLLVVLCAFLLLTQFFYWQSIAAAVLTIPALLFIGLSLFSLQRGGSALDSRHMVNVTSRLFLQAIPIATLLFLAIPRVSGPGWIEGNSGKSITGLSSRMSPGGIAELSRSDAIAFRAEFDGTPPTAEELYWRGPVMAGFDGSDWFILPSITYNSFTAAGSPNTVSHYIVTMEPTHNPWLLALDTPASLPRDINDTSRQLARINEDRQITATERISNAIRYRASSVLTDRFTPSMQPGAENLLITHTNPRATAFAQTLRQRYPDETVFTLKLLEWFNREPFHYTLNPPPLDDNPIDRFLFESRRGFCEHYAGSFVFMLRAAGIPARIVTGYQGGEQNGDYMIVRQSDAHAWAEVFIRNEWRRFDPTASVAPERVERGIEAALSSERGTQLLEFLKNEWLKSVQLRWDSVNFAWQRLIIGFDSESQNALWKRLGLQKPSGLIIALLLLAASVIWVSIILLPPMLSRAPQRSACELQWRRLCDWLARKGLPRKEHESSSAYISRMCTRLPQHRRALQLLLENYHRGVYGREGQNQRLHRRMAWVMKAEFRALVKRYGD